MVGGKENMVLWDYAMPIAFGVTSLIVRLAIEVDNFEIHLTLTTL